MRRNGLLLILESRRGTVIERRSDHHVPVVAVTKQGTPAHSDAGGDSLLESLLPFYEKELIDEGSEDEVILAETLPAPDDAGGNPEQESEFEIVLLVVPTRRKQAK